jgi:hypothetical protein
VVVLLWACTGSGDTDGDPSAKSAPQGVETLTGAAELETYLKDQYARSVNPGMANLAEDGGGRPSGDASEDASSDGAAAGDGDAAGYSQTNLQEAGVDEADVVKTDGAYLYVASGAGFEIVAIAGEMSVAATGQVAGPVEALYLYGEKLVVLYRVGPVDGPWPEIDVPMGGGLFGMPYWIPEETAMGVAIFDIADPQAPLELKAVEFDGHLVSSRRIGGRLHLVQQFRPVLPPLEFWYDGSPEDLETVVAANRAAIAEMTLAELIPHYREAGTAGDAAASSYAAAVSDAAADAPLVVPEAFYCPVSKDGGGTITTIVTFDLDDPQLPFTSAGIVADAHIVYASTSSLYTATHRYLFGADIDISEETTIYKFDLTGERVRYAGSGIIPGWILNQFSLGEYQGVLRVAATIGHAGGWGAAARNQVYCLEPTGETLEIIGEVEDLAPGEQIYAARFMGPRGYLVTFVNIDPLFTLDLSDPTAPRVVGELKVPGYSDYIHPFGDDYLIAVGKDAEVVAEENMAWYQGVQLSIFDVSDFASPELKHKVILGDRGTHTEAAHDHKAFTFWAEENLLALPIELYQHPSPPDGPWVTGAHTFSGLHVYRVSSVSGFDFLGRISTQGEEGSRFNPWTRGVFVAEDVLAVTRSAVRRAATDDMAAGAETLYMNSAD